MPGQTADEALAHDPVEIAMRALRGKWTYRESTYPPRVCYSLTQQGEALDPVIRALGDWGPASGRAG